MIEPLIIPKSLGLTRPSSNQKNIYPQKSQKLIVKKKNRTKVKKRPAILTKQISIKLNADLFRPVLEYLKAMGSYTFRTDSSMTAFALWFMIHYLNDPIECKECKKTRFEIIKETCNKTTEECMFSTLAAYRQFQKRPNLPP